MGFTGVDSKELRVEGGGLKDLLCEMDIPPQSYGMLPMTLIKRSLDTVKKLTILSQDSQYDPACACGMSDDDRRHRSADDTWIYPVALPNRPKTYLFKTLISNVCSNDCKYCPLRVPGFGHVTVKTIVKLRSKGNKIHSIEDMGRPGKRLRKAEQYVKFGM